MGIARLNSYLKEHCSDFIVTQPISVLKKKRIVIDVQMYMYQFMCETNASLMENMFLMCTLLVRHDVVPLFVFDNRKKTKTNTQEENKDEKKQERKETRNKAIDSVVKMINDNQSDNDTNDRTMTEATWQKLKRQIVRLKNSQITQIKKLIQTFGFTYADAEDEADEVCAHVAITNNAYGCLSDDTDMFAYGCTHIFRNLNMTNQTVTVINVAAILKKLNMSKEELREVCVLSHNDYNCKKKNVMDLFNIMEQFALYKSKSNKNNDEIRFYEWFIERNVEYETYDAEFKKIYNIFDVFAKAVPLPRIAFSNKAIDHTELRDAMESEGFHYM